MTTILVGVDASARSHDALAFARRLAAPVDAQLLVASVFPYEPTLSRAASAAYQRALQQDAQELVDQLADGARTEVIGRRSPAHGLHDLAEREGAALIVVGSSHVGAVGRVLPGSTAERLLHGAPCPVAVVPKGWTARPIATVGVAYDGSEESTAALRAAAGVATGAGAALRAILVRHWPAIDSPAFMVGSEYSSLREDAEREQRAGLERAVSELGVPAESSVRTGEPVSELAQESESLDLLITGSRGYGPLRAVLTGGVTGPLLREAACPVIVLPRGVTPTLGEVFAGATASA